MMRRMLVSALVVLALLAQTGCSLPGRAAGPMTWIDQPLDGTHFPLGVITLQAHASDLDGVVSIDFSVGGSLLQTMPADGGRFGQAMIEWTPPGPGTYQISASALDGAGNRGDQASVQISIGNTSPTPTSQPGTTGTPTPATAATPSVTTSQPGKTGTPTPAAAATPSVTPKPAPGGPVFTLSMNANCRKGPGTAYPSVDALLKGQTVPIQGRSKDFGLVARGPAGKWELLGLRQHGKRERRRVGCAARRRAAAACHRHAFAGR